MMKWNLLTEDLFRVEATRGPKTMSLPRLLEALGKDEVSIYPGIQRHQEDAFHVFLCYLAGAVLACAVESNTLQKEGFWHDGIRAISGDDPDAAWNLLVEDPLRPAFMQPPVTDKKIFTKYKPGARTPDDLDVLQTAKNHDVKMARIYDSSPEDWIYALISLQTMCGLLGKGKSGGHNRGIARMNSGYGNRPIIELLISQSWGGRWSNAVERLLKYRTQLLRVPWQYKENGLVLVWTAPWDLTTSLPLGDLDPFFIEAARAIRLEEDKNKLVAKTAGTKTQRLAAKDQKGNLGDPWVPLDIRKDSALTLSASGFTPELLRNLIFQDGYQLLPMQKPLRNWSGKRVEFVGSVLVRGQGVTDGFHSVRVLIPASVHNALFSSSAERERLSSLSKQAIAYAGTMQNQVLKPAVFSLLEAGPERIDFDKREISSWWQSCRSRFSKHWGQQYFSWLWKANDEPDDEVACRMWLELLRDVVWKILQDSMKSYPSKNGCQYKARVRAESLFWGLLYKHFAELKEVHCEPSTK